MRGGAVRACVRAEDDGITVFLTHQELQAVRRMVRHKAQLPTATKLEVVQAGWPKIKSRSGDPTTKYHLVGSPLYDLLFTEPAPANDPIVTTAPAGDLIRASGQVVPVRKS